VGGKIYNYVTKCKIGRKLMNESFQGFYRT